MDVFSLRDEIIGNYRSYVESFLTINDDRIRDFVKKSFDKGIFWPEPLLQLNPAYEKPATVGDLVRDGTLHPECLAIFGDIKLYAHQVQAIKTAAKWEHYVLTTGTGSGKTLTYLIPIFDYILKNQDMGSREPSGVTAVIIYPMNALINSQAQELSGRLKNRTDITFARYTGLESHEQRKEILANPPDILLTNFVMLELILSRPHESKFVRPNASLKFLVLDELHTHRGRQGADVAMLVRKLRARAKNPDMLCIGTSATVAGAKTASERRKEVALAAEKIFGVTIKEENVIEEKIVSITLPVEELAGPSITPFPSELYYDSFFKGAPEAQSARDQELTQSLVAEPTSKSVEDQYAAESVEPQPEPAEGEPHAPATQPPESARGDRTGAPPKERSKESSDVLSAQAALDKLNITPDQLREAIERGIGENPTAEETIRYPLTRWFEMRFGVDIEDDGALRRAMPTRLSKCAKELSEITGLPLERCSQALRELLHAGNRIIGEDAAPLLAFKLHQFVSQGGSVFSTLEHPEKRAITMDGKVFASKGSEPDKLFYPLRFCRECGQEYYVVNMDKESGRILPQMPLSVEMEQDAELTKGYLLLDEEGIWGEELENLPDRWLYVTSTGTVSINSSYKEYIPRRMRLRPDGFPAEAEEDGVNCWYFPEPFKFCLNCGIIFEQKSTEWKKLSRLSSDGRSTATTLMSITALDRMKKEGELPPQAQKILSFTDNRQDASLQAGHFNDFVHAALLRGAIYQALTREGELTHDVVGRKVFDALSLPRSQYSKKKSLKYGSELEKIDKTFRECLEYRVIQDLKRGWRVVQPNLEQCGLLRIDYGGLEEICRKSEPWEKNPLLSAITPERRVKIIRDFLNYLRGNLAIETRVLEPEYLESLKKRAAESLVESWGFAEEEEPEGSSLFAFPEYTVGVHARIFSLSPVSYLGRYLRRKELWGLERDMGKDEYLELVTVLIDALIASGLLVVKKVSIYNSDFEGVRIPIDCIIWKKGDGTFPGPDPVRTRRITSFAPLSEEEQREANRFFARFYMDLAPHLVGVEAAEHTGQIAGEKREEREKAFREGELSCLFCSPTMELGIDIRDLNLVHLRNIPPTPANYAQRSGRAGRSGEQALILAYCSSGSGHDQYFFRNQEKMVSGRVLPPRLDLANEDLIRAHVHSIWLSKTGCALGRSIDDIIDIDVEGCPLKDDIKMSLGLSSERKEECLSECRAMLSSCPGLEDSGWYTEDWLELVLTRAPEEFDRAFDRWREMYKSAKRMHDEALSELGVPKLTKKEREAARRKERDASRQLDLLLCQNIISIEESDFYPYRYLASEGFLPGYNFPRLPVRAFVSSSKKQGDYISRDRFLAVSEFGPGNLIYHEGNKHRVVAVFLSPEEVEERIGRAKICLECGYFHGGESSLNDLCENCGAELSGVCCEHIANLLEMSAVRAVRAEKITCDEEERVREGYVVTTHYRYAPTLGGASLKKEAVVRGSDGSVLLDLVYAPTANLIRINHGWRRASETGFNLDTRTGAWRKPADMTEPAHLREEGRFLSQVRIMARDTRNALFIRPSDKLALSESQIATLQYALKKGMETLFEIEEDELGTERLGKGQKRTIMYYDNTEGSLGVLARLIENPDAIALVALEALAVCHFDERGDDLVGADKCARACYDCLLSYRNQRDHLLLDRNAVRDVLLMLTGARVEIESHGRSYEGQFEWLFKRTDPDSELEREFLRCLFDRRLKLPDDAQVRIRDAHCEADFFYAPYTCVFVDGPVHDGPNQAGKDALIRNRLKELGYRVIVIRYDVDMNTQIEKYPDLFGPVTP